MRADFLRMTVLPSAWPTGWSGVTDQPKPPLAPSVVASNRPMCPTSQNFEPGVLLTRCVMKARRLVQSWVLVGQAGSLASGLGFTFPVGSTYCITGVRLASHMYGVNTQEAVVSHPP